MIRVTCRLTAKNRDQLRNPTLGNRIWATFFAWSVDFGKGALTIREVANHCCNSLGVKQIAGNVDGGMLLLVKCCVC